MKRKIIVRCMIGALLGIAINVLMAIMISLGIGDGNYYVVAPELIKEFQTEINAVLVQSIVSLMYGAVWGGSSLIWEQEEWSILKQTIAHLVICSVATLFVAYSMRWMYPNFYGILIYFGIFFVIYFVIWISKYLFIRNKINQLNAKLNRGI